MASECVAYRDSKGSLHTSPEKATLEDLAGVLGRVGDEGGMTSGVARMIFDKRSEIERVFAEHDAMVAASSLPGELNPVSTVNGTTPPSIHVVN